MWSVVLILLVAPFVFYRLFRDHEQVQEARLFLSRRWRLVRFQLRRLRRKWTQLTLQISRPLLRLSQRVPSNELRNLLLLGLFLLACFLPYALRPLSSKLAALVQIPWSMLIFGVGLSIAFMHFLVEQELDAIANGLLERHRKGRSEAPLAKYLAFEGLVDVGTLAVACLGMIAAFAFLVQGLYELGFHSWYTVQGQNPTLATWLLYTALSVFSALDIFDTFATYQLTVATVRHNGAFASTLVFLFKAIFDILLIAKLRDWWSKRSLAREAIPALTHGETRARAEETIRRCRQSAIPLLLDTYHTSHSVEVKCSALKLLSDLRYKWREDLYIEALLSKDEEVRKAAATLLGKAPTEEAIKALGRTLQDSSPEVRASATASLGMPSFKDKVTPLLLKALQDGAAQVRESATNVLAQLAPKEARVALVEALKDKEAQVRKEAVAAVARFPEDVFPQLEPMFKDPNREVRKQVVIAIAEQLEAEPKKASEFLAYQALNDEDADIRLEAISQLQWSQSVETIPIVGLTLMADTSYEVRQAVVEALGYMEHKDAIEWLDIALQDKHYMVRSKGIEALGDLRAHKSIPKVVELLKDNDRDVRKQAVTTLGEFGAKEPDIITAVEKMLDDPEEQVRAAAVEALSELSSGRSPALQKGLEDPHPSVRKEALHALDSPIPEGFVEKVISLAQSPNEDRDVRLAAIAVLGFYNAAKWPAIAAQAEPLLAELLKSDDPLIRKETIESVSAVDFEGAEKLLLPLLQSDESELRRDVTYALQFMKGPGIVEALLDALRDDNLGVRIAAAEALAEHAERTTLKDAMSALLTALKEDDHAVSKHAAMALAQDGSQEAFEALLQALSHPQPEVRTAAAEAFLIRNSEKEPSEADKERSSEALRNALQDEHTDVRVAAAEALAKVDLPANVEALSKALRRDASDWVRFSAANSLLELQPNAAAPALLSALAEDEDEWVRASSAEALGALQPAEALPVLQERLKVDRAPSVRENIVEALIAFNDKAANETMTQWLLEEQSSDVRDNLLDAFEELQLTAHTDKLKIALTQESKPKLRRRINKLLKELAPPAPQQEPEEDPFEQTIQQVASPSDFQDPT